MSQINLYRASGAVSAAANHLAIACYFEGVPNQRAVDVELELVVSSLRQCAEALGYTLTIAPREPELPVIDLVPASNIEPGDFVDGHFLVGEVLHGVLEGQIQLRSYDDTATMFVMENELVLIEREVRA